MAKSRTSKQASHNKVKHTVRVAALDAAADLFSHYLKRWSKEQIQRLINANQLPLIPIKDGLQVGRHRVKSYNKEWRLYNSCADVVNSFTSKKSAVLYSLMHQSHRYKTADEILAKDQKLSKLETDFQHYEYSMRRAAARKDYTSIDVVASRYYDTKIVLDEARNDLEKTLRMNKYLKVWETGKPL